MSRPGTTLMAMLLTAAVWNMAATPVAAQFGSDRIDRPLDRPTVSPYLNLFRRGSPVLNYYGLVRPQQEFYQQSEDLQQGRYSGSRQRQMDPRSQRDTNGRMSGVYTMGVTGHGVSFGTYGSRSGSQSGGNSAAAFGSLGAPQGSDESSDDNQFGGSVGPGAYSGHSVGFGSGSYGQRGQF